MGLNAPRAHAVRADGAAKVTGEAPYTADLTLAGMAHAKFRFADVAHARIRRIDTSKAQALPGVLAVITQDDVPDVRVAGGVGGVKDRTLFARDVVRFDGEIVAAVAARTPEIAEEACRLVEFEYEELEPVVDAEAALQPGAPLVHEEWAAYAATPGYVRDGNSCSFTTIVKGDAKGVLAAADRVVVDRYATDMSHPAPIEPHAVLAQWQGGRVVIWSTTQAPFVARQGIAEALQVPESSIRVLVTHLGGGFGGKCDVHFEPHVAALARKAKRPVRLVLSRREEFIATDMARHPIVIELETAVADDGTMLARAARLTLDTGAYAGHGPLLGELATMVAAGPYRVPNLLVEARVAYTNKTVAGSTRGPTAPQIVWALEQHNDHVAAELGIDRLDFRLANVVVDGDEGPTGQPIEACGLRDCLEAAAKLIDWRGPRGADEGLGLAVGWWPTVTNRAGASVEMAADGTARVITGAQENGSGAVMALANLTGQELGLRPDQVTVVYQDSDSGSWDAGSCGSQTTFNVGRAVLAAAQDVAGQLRDLAADELEIDGADLAFGEGELYVKGSPSHAVSITDLVQKAHGTRRQAVVAHHAPAAPAPPAVSVEACTGRVGVTAFESPTFFCHAARVRLDRETGVVAVDKVVAVHDFGRVLNRLGAEGQVEGGVVHGLGIALSEGLRFADGRQRNPHFTDYKLRTIADAPQIEVAFVETDNPEHPLGAKGVGEPPVIPTAGAIGNAIRDAGSAAVQQLPMTPDRVLAALHGTEAS